jgi:hypothetical protein
MFLFVVKKERMFEVEECRTCPFEIKVHLLLF